MAHARTQVINAVYELLTDSPEAWGLVWKHRLPPKRGVLPYVQIWIEDENIEPLDIHPGHLQQRLMTLVTKGSLRYVDNESNEARLDDMATELEETLTHSTLNTELSSKLKMLKLENSRIELFEEGDTCDHYDVTLQWIVQVHTIEGAPETLV